ncbi:hypothetical protein [Dactylosporangium sp. CA-139066]|uniref:hypothetical protein n=1 Tax=Dactylosporangium sp. CA-139066 TaxID=3239930 RepID=UPI003D948A32
MSAVVTREPTVQGPPPRTVYAVGGIVLAAILVAAVVALAAWPFVSRRTAGNHVVSGLVAGREEATLDLLTGVTAVTVSAEDLGDTLYRVESPQTPTATESTADRGRIDVAVNGADASVIIKLNRDVRWTLRFTGGAQRNGADLHDLRHLAGVQYVGGVSTIELSLPPADGAVPVRVGGGADAVRIHATGRAPARVRAGGGAGTVTVDGEAHTGVTAGSVFAGPGWDDAHDRYDVDATGGVSTITVDRNR